MKLIKAYVRTYMVDKVIHALREMGVPRFTAIDIRAFGDEVEPQHLGLTSEHAGTYTAMVKLEIICARGETEKIVNAIVDNARTGYRGDGIIAVSPVEEVTKIRSGDVTKD